MATLDPDTWEALMDSLMAAAEQADYVPGDVAAPGQGPGSVPEGDDPLSIRHADKGPLAYVLNEALDSATARGMDCDDLLDQVAEAGGDDVGRDDVDAAVSGDDRDPDPDLLEAFASVFGLDADILRDAARRGGATLEGPASPPPGF